MRIIPLITLLAMLWAGTGFAQDVVRVEKVSRQKQGYLGVETVDVTRRLQKENDLSVDRGAYIENVVHRSPADKAGLQEGDVILAVAGKTVDDAEDLTRVVRSTKPNTDVKVEIARGKEKKELSVTMGRLSGSNFFSYSVPSPSVPKTPRSFAFSFRSDNEIAGMRVEELTRQLAEYFDVAGGKGLLVTEVEDGSDAADAGFKAGDILVKANGHTIRNPGDIMDEAADSDSGTVPLTVVRKGKTLNLNLKLDSENNDDAGLFIPGGHRHMRIEIPQIDRSGMDRLREELREMHLKLRDGMKELRRSLHRAFSEL